MGGIKAAAAVALSGALAVAGCGSSSKGSTRSVASGASTKASSAQSTASTRGAATDSTASPAPAIGQSQRVKAGATALTVAVTRVLDPLRGSGASLLPGYRAVGVMVRIHNDGPGVYDSSATGDISIAGSSGTASPVFAQSGLCQTPLRDFDNYLSPGEVRAGCVAFSLPGSARLLAVRFSPHAKAAGRVSWSVS